MKSLEVNEIKKLQFEILKNVANYCEKNNMEYFLAFGTLLGAVRHEGYIPWDDDIDILMPRKDYEKFIKDFNCSIYEVKSHLKDKKYPYPFAKVSDERTKLVEKIDLKYDIGINIDVFPLDQFKGTRNRLQIMYGQIKFYRIMLALKSVSINPERELYKNIILKLGKVLLSPFSYNSIICKIDKKAQKDKNISQSDFVGCIIETYSLKDLMDPKIFQNKKKLQFETKLFFVPEGYDSYLSNIYGDYMKEPPKELQVTHHDSVAFMK